MYKCVLLLCLLASQLPAGAQGRLLLDEAQARKNLVASRPPVAPAGHKSGKVVLLVQIGPDGRVTSAKPDSGPSFLRDAAVDAVKQWRFKPFTVHEEKVTASTKLTVEFGVAAEASIPQPKAPGPQVPAPQLHAPASPPAALEEEAVEQFQALEQKCSNLVATQADPAQQASACRAAADQAATLKTENRFLLQRLADVYAATALMRTDDLKAAVAYGSKAIKAVAEGHDDEAGASAAYAVRGQAEAFAGDLPAADLDLIKAESFERRALAAAAGQPTEPAVRAALKNLLLFHAQLLKGLKEPAKAAAKTAEADKL